MLKKLLLAALVAALLAPGTVVPADSGPSGAPVDSDYRFIDIDKVCDKGEPRMCSVPLELLADIAQANMMLDHQGRQAVAVLNAQSDEIRKLRAENARLKDIKGCAKLQVVPQSRTSFRSM